MNQAGSPWPTAERAIATILVRESFANARMHYATRGIVVLCVLLAFSLFGSLVLWNRPTAWRYVLTTPDGLIMPMVDLAQANHPDDYVVRWTVDAVTRLYSFDFLNYRGQFQRAQKDMTVVGWQAFEKAMEVSGNFNAVKGNLFVTTAAPTGPGRVVKKGDNMGRYSWKVEFPMQITYRSSELTKGGTPRETSQALKMTVTVIRQPEHINFSGLGVRFVLAE